MRIKAVNLPNACHEICKIALPQAVNRAWSVALSQQVTRKTWLWAEVV
jgi:hypothetical protein